ncbi:MAG TPA: MBL fold metallo-hydrolase [Acetobacteraceae bacterium]|jgi:glyoxylase-like metal-dependent hydrolase (beta-lactamase superfamily II)|nr:MBL fold metallo-hydrolase [Acetobacteraceae bacterium]
MTTAFRPARQAPGVHHHAVGEVRVTALNDGMFEGSFDWLTNIDSADPPALHTASFRAIPPRITVNAFLLHLGAQLVLVDSGCGGLMGPSLGRLAENLAAMGVAPETIDTVLLTHLHPDHVGGLVDAQGKALLSNAELIVHEAEPPFWGDDAVLAQASGDNRGFIQLTRAVLEAYRGRVRTIASGGVLPGITVVPEPGHTPGHCGWLVASGGAALLIWGDIVHMPGVQFAHPGAGMGFDIDGAQAIATRQRMMDMVATDRLLVAGMHLDFPTFGHVARAGEGYAFIPEVWTP